MPSDFRTPISPSVQQSEVGTGDESACHIEVLDADAVASICKAARETTIAKMSDGTLPGVKIGREWICTRAALMTELTRLSLANVGQKEPPQTSHAAPRPLQAAQRPVVPHQPPARPGKRRNVPPVLPPFPGDQVASPSWKS